MITNSREFGYSEEFAKAFHEIEKLFVHSFNDYHKIISLIKSTRQEDLFEHWDYEINGKKYDIKGSKKVLGTDDEPDPKYNWIETQGSSGHFGWLYGKADYFAFECIDFFIVVTRQKLIDLIQNKCQNKNVTERPLNPITYKFYHRINKHDIIVLIDTIDLILISENIIQKIKN